MPKPPTIRISNLRQNTTKDGLFKYFGLTDEDVLSHSLAATENETKTATITFADKAKLKKAKKLHSKNGKLHDVVVDVDDTFDGFTLLSEGTTVDIVSLHGLSGHAFRTWMDPESGRMWLRDILPNECSGARILTYGYNANIFKGPSKGRVRTFAGTFLEDLLVERSEAKRRPLVLVAHSLGGIVIKQALIVANNRSDERFKDILESIHGVVFLGTPHMGGNGVPLGLFITSLLKLFNTGVQSDLIRALDPKSTYLFDMTDDFRQIIDKQGIKIRTLFEEKETKFGFWPFRYRILIVTEVSATLGAAKEVRASINGDHLSMCKFRGVSEASRVCNAIRELALSPSQRPDVHPNPTSPRVRTTLEDYCTYTIDQNQIAGPSQAKLPPRFNDAPLELLSGHFTGRAKELAHIVNIFDSMHDDDVPTRCALVGTRGVGKTQVTYKLADLSYDCGRYTHIFWMVASTVENLYQGYSKLLYLVNHPDRLHRELSIRLTAARRWLEESDSVKWLLVIDNVESETVKFLREHLPRKNLHGNILFTTRSESVARALTQVPGKQHQIVELRIPNTEDAEKLLRKHLKHEDGEVEVDPGKIQEVVECFGRLPFAISQSAAYMNETGSTLDDLLTLFKSEHKFEMLNWKNDLTKYQEKSIAAMFTCQLDDLEWQFPDASNFLKILPYFDPHSIPLDMLTMSAATISGSQSGGDDIVRADESDASPPTSRQMTTLLDLIKWPIRLQSAITQLQNRNLTKRQGSSSLWIHGLTQLVVLDRTIRGGDEQDWFECAVELACRAFEQIEDTVSPDHWTRCEIFIPHVQSLTRREKKMSKGAGRSLLFANRAIVRYLYGRVRYDEAGALGEQVLHDAERLLGLEHIDTFLAMKELAWIYRFQGRSNDARTLLERVKAGEEKLLGLEDINTLWAMHDLALVYRDQGRYRDAELLLERVLVGRKRQLGREHINTLWTTLELACVYRDQGRYADAEAMLERVLVGMRNLFESKEHIHTLRTMYELACVYRNQGRYAEAERVLENVVAGQERQLGSEHANTLSTRQKLAGVYREQGRYVEAEGLVGQVLEGRRRLLGSEHFSTFTAMHELALVYQCQERYAEAEVLLVPVLAHREKELGLSHPHTRNTRELLAQVYEKLGRLEDAQVLMGQCALESSGN